MYIKSDETNDATNDATKSDDTLANIHLKGEFVNILKHLT